MNGDPSRVADALGLRRVGSEYKGPCPICGGKDRFHVRAGRSAEFLVHCRHGCSYSDLARELESRGIVDRDDYVAPAHRRADLELADHMILVMQGAALRGEKISQSDREAVAMLITKVDQGRGARLRALKDKLGGNNGVENG